MNKKKLSYEELLELYETQTRRLEKIIKHSDNQTKELLRLNKELEDAAHTDPMTKLYNRRFFYDISNKIISMSLRENLPVCVAMFDIDKFKSINDTYGHHIGDIAICEVGKILKQYLRSSDLVARFGGEEFCVLLDNISLDDTQKVLEKIRAAFEENVLEIDTVKLKYTVSIGAVFGLNENIEELIKIADEKLYFSKNNGRNQVTLEDLTLN